MSSSEPQLVVFTVLSQMAVGITVCFTGINLVHPDTLSVDSIAIPLAALTVLVLGFGAATLHLGHPLGGVRSLANLRYSWLSREILAFGGYGGILALDVTLRCLGVYFEWISIFASILGLAALYTSARVYGPPGYPALDNTSPLVFFLITAAVLGAGFLIYTPYAMVHSPARLILTIALIAGGVIHTTIPSLWRSGGSVLRMSGGAHYRSAAFWTRLVVQFGMGLSVIIISETIPLWLPPVLLAGELLGRATFFSHTVHASVNLGKPY